MADRRFHSQWKIYFVGLLVLFGSIVLAFIGLKVALMISRTHISNQRSIVDQQTKQLSSYTLLTWYNKLQAVKTLEAQQVTLPWSNYITQIVAMLEDLKRTDMSSNDGILLSDFNVSMDKITLKWQVSDLELLYHSQNSTDAQSLIDRFSGLDFVQNIRIQTYDRIDDTNYYEFVLEANVINDAGTGTTTTK